jgi:Predicted glycosyltransferases
MGWVVESKRQKAGQALPTFIWSVNVRAAVFMRQQYSEALERLSEGSETPRSVIVIPNWNGWPDTIRCLASIQNLANCSVEVLVIDNASTGKDVDEIRAWCAGRHGLVLKEHNNPEGDAAGCGHSDAGYQGLRILLVRSPTNSGFSAAVNIGLRYAAARGARYAWLLNNDTTVEQDSLARLEEVAHAHGDLVLVSSRIVSMDDPSRNWFEGGIYRPATATSAHVAHSIFSSATHPYLTACALLIPVAVLNRIGLFNEALFLYGEDVDYSIRARRDHIPLRVALKSVVRHKGSASSIVRSPSAYRFHVRNIIWVMCEHHGRARLLTIIPCQLAKLALLCLSGKVSRAAAGAYLRALYDAIRCCAPWPFVPAAGRLVAGSSRVRHK